MSRSPESGFNPFDYSSAANLSTSCRRFARNPTRERGGREGRGSFNLDSFDRAIASRTNERTNKEISLCALSLSLSGGRVENRVEVCSPCSFVYGEGVLHVFSVREIYSIVDVENEEQNCRLKDSIRMSDENRWMDLSFFLSFSFLFPDANGGGLIERR